MSLTVIEIGGTSKLWNAQPTLPAVVGASAYVDPLVPLLGAGTSFVNTVYEGSLMPLLESVASGVAAVQTIITGSGPFVLFGISQGALIASNIYDELRYGSLTARHDDFKGGFMFGNPRRQAGKTFPGCPDPGGHGIAVLNLLSDCEDLWWEFAHPGDGVAIQFDNSAGTLAALALEFIEGDFMGCGSLFQLLFQEQALDIIGAVLSLYIAFFAGGHVGGEAYTTAWKPLAPGDTRNCYQIVADRINEIAASL